MDSKKLSEEQSLNVESGSRESENEVKTLIDLNKPLDGINLNFEADDEGEISQEE